MSQITFGGSTITVDLRTVTGQNMAGRKVLNKDDHKSGRILKMIKYEILHDPVPTLGKKTVTELNFETGLEAIAEGTLQIDKCKVKRNKLQGNIDYLGITHKVIIHPGAIPGHKTKDILFKE